MVSKTDKPAPVMVKVKTDTVIGSTYAQITGVVVTDTDITLEFAYINPRPGNTEAHVVSRITLPRTAGEQLANGIIATVKEHEAKRKQGGKDAIRTTN